MGQQQLDAIDHRDDVGARLPLDVHDDGGHFVHPGGLADVLDIIDHAGDVGQLDGRAVAVRDDQGRIVGGSEQLVIGADLVGLVGAIEVSLGLVDVGGDQGGAKVLEVQAVGGQGGGIRLDADSGLLAAADADESDAR